MEKTSSSLPLFLSTVLGTGNVMMAACLAEGTTVIEHAACEPEVVVEAASHEAVRSYGPALLAAWLSRRKFVVQEQNSFPGLVNRWWGERADLVFAIKIRVPNPNGILKIGMPADVDFTRQMASK